MFGEIAMRTLLKILVTGAFVFVLASCTPRKEAAIHFQQGFSPSPTNDPVVELTYDGRMIFSGKPRPNPLTDHPHVVTFQLGPEASGTLQIRISNVLTQSLEITWAKGLAVGLRFTNGTVTYIQSSGFHYALE